VAFGDLIHNRSALARPAKVIRDWLFPVFHTRIADIKQFTGRTRLNPAVSHFRFQTNEVARRLCETVVRSAGMFALEAKQWEGAAYLPIERHFPDDGALVIPVDYCTRISSSRLSFFFTSHHQRQNQNSTFNNPIVEHSHSLCINNNTSYTSLFTRALVSSPPHSRNHGCSRLMRMSQSLPSSSLLTNSPD
jgi:hypothetical protein